MGLIMTRGTEKTLNSMSQEKKSPENHRAASGVCTYQSENRPTVSVLVSTYNWKEALALCLHSVLIQTVKPDEIVIADDGSREDIRELIDRIRKETNIPIIHVWHEDKGFRLSEIRNKAIIKAKGEYIIQIDGDVVLDKNFIADHLEVAEQGHFVCGSRIGLSSRLTKRFFYRGLHYRPSFFILGFMYMFNSIRSRFLRQYLSTHYAQKNILRLRGCNMAFWKADLLKVNGYNEYLTMWGQEDAEIAHRLIHAGISKKYLKAGGIEYHLYHKPASRENLKFHNQILREVIEKKIIRCKNGIIKES